MKLLGPNWAWLCASMRKLPLDYTEEHTWANIVAYHACFIHSAQMS